MNRSRRGGVMAAKVAASGAVTVAVAGALAAGSIIAATPAAADAEKPLAGRVVVIDPGHQLGNRNFPRKVDRLVPAGGFRKACNTTGTATNAGYPEATAVWKVSVKLKRRLTKLGARVRMTRASNRNDRWGPCVDRRGRAGNKRPADLKVSVHADGNLTAGARGFHIIRPARRRHWTSDIAAPSRRLARDVRREFRASGFRTASYVAGGTGIDVRSDLATLNLADLPTVVVELGNMRHRRDARLLTRRPGQRRYAEALTAAVSRFLTR